MNLKYKNPATWLILIMLAVFATSSSVFGEELSEQIIKTGETAESWFFQARWSPYIAGIGIGLLSWLAFLLSNHPLGASTAYVRTSGMIEQFFKGNKATKKPYYLEFIPKIDWEWMLVVGIVIGAFMAAFSSGDFSWNLIPARWNDAFGDATIPRIIAALFGGALIGFGSRWAQGCTSGHGISGTLQLAVSSWLAVVCFFVGGIMTALIIFKVVA